jgi:hypothetical protein
VCISILGFIVAIKGYRRKTGVLIRGSFGIASATACNDKYISQILLDNLKDRAVTLFAIYLKVGPNYYIEIEDFENEPLILKPFELYQKQIGPIEFYSVNNNRIIMKELFDNPSIKMQIVLSTSDGKYKVPRNIKYWNPIGDFFDNHLTAIVKTVHSEYKGKYLGANVLYTVEFIGYNGKEEIVSIEKDDYHIKKFRTFSLTEESLISKKTLESHLQKQIDLGNLQVKSFMVYDMNSWRKVVHEFYDGKTINAKYFNAFEYHIMGRFGTILSDRKLRRENGLRKQIPQVVTEEITLNDESADGPPSVE